MNEYFSSFVKNHGGDDYFASKINVSRQTVGNIKRGRNKATDKLIDVIMKEFPDFEKIRYYSMEGINKYEAIIAELRADNERKDIKIQVLEENYSSLITKYMGKHKDVSNQAKLDFTLSTNIVNMRDDFDLMSVANFDKNIHGFA